jgi:hypothetical protein
MRWDFEEVRLENGTNFHVKLRQTNKRLPPRIELIERQRVSYSAAETSYVLRCLVVCVVVVTLKLTGKLLLAS